MVYGDNYGSEVATGAGWEAVAPLMQAYQRNIAERRAASGPGDDAAATQEADKSPTSRKTADGLTEAERQQVSALKARDKEVRDHEQAHARVGGPYAGEPSYSYQTGPDGRRYAVGGEVPIDVSPVQDDPEATIAKMDVVKAAALAPAEPSSADRQVAALADAQRMQAIADLNALRSAERQGEAVDLRA